MARRFIDIGANLLDPMFRGVYRGKQAHAEDLDAVLERAWAAGVERIVVTAGTLADAREAVAFCERDPARLSCTVGVHPTRCNEFEENVDGPEAHAAALAAVVDAAPAGRVAAVGECGLDYDRLEFCAKDVQLRHFGHHVSLAQRTGLPMFLHNRNTGGDFERVVRERRDDFGRGVVHSFTGSMEEMQALAALDLHIGINGCSLKTAENVAVAAAVPEHLLLLETDAPWCGIRPTHAGSGHVQTTWPTKKKERFEAGHCVKDRNEPCTMAQVAEVVAAARNVPVDELAARVHANSLAFFGWAAEQ